MKHARADYDRFQDPDGKIPADEPVMLFRAQDKHFALVCDFYAMLLKYDQGDPEMIRAVKDHAALGRAWPHQKRPDL